MNGAIAISGSKYNGYGDLLGLRAVRSYKMRRGSFRQSGDVKGQAHGSNPPRCLRGGLCNERMSTQAGENPALRSRRDVPTRPAEIVGA